MNLGFVCEWEKDRIKTWSSTPYSLYNALNNLNNINLIDINVKSRFSRYHITPMFRSYLQLLLDTKVLKKKLDAAIQIGDIGTMKSDFYIYQDLNASSIIKLHNDHPEVYKYCGFQHFDIDRLKRRLETQVKIYEKCSGIFVFSEYLASSMKEDGYLPESKVHVVYSGINVKPLVNVKYETDKDCRNILFVGRDFHRKGGDLLVESFKILKSEYKSKVNLIIAGPSKWPMQEEIPEGVTFLGDASWEILQKYYATADLFCLPSRFEAFGIAIVEALCFGLPCIVRNDFAMKELVQQDINGYLINSDNKYELADYIAKALDNDDMQRYVYDNRVHYREKYSWNTVAQNMMNIIENKNTINLVNKGTV